MSKITFLGTASAVPARNQQNSHFILQAGERHFLVDCVGNPVVRLAEAGIDPLVVTDLVLTHFHPDHVSAVPLFLMDLWLMGRTAPLEVYGLQDNIDRFEKLMALFEWERWSDFYPVHVHPLGSEERMPFYTGEEVQGWASPVCHMIPAIGLRFALPEGVLAYSTDTSPCEAVVRLAGGADILVHEATGFSNGHSSAAEAGQVAAQAGAKTLVLTHYNPGSDMEALKRQAQSTFSGEVIVAKDLMTLIVG